MTRPFHLLVFRLSSLGDVAMTVPVLRLLLQQHTSLHITVVSTAFVAPLFAGIERLRFYPAEPKGRHRGLLGLYRLYRELNADATFDAVADLHNVLRTKILRSFFRLGAKPVAAIDKGRKEKQELTRPQNKKLRPLKSTFHRYADVFTALGFPVQLNTTAGLAAKPAMPDEIKLLKEQGLDVIGIAPFAQYAEKTYPLEKMKEVVRLLAAGDATAVLLFGGKGDSAALAEWEAAFPNVYNRAGRGLAAELALIAHLDLMVSMDSANMHLASLYGVPVVSVWGGTHPYLGFMGWGQSLNNAVQIELPCRPSSVFGSKPCPNKGACMQGINPLQITEKIFQQLSSVSP